jgi:hypothetical protein
VTAAVATLSAELAEMLAVVDPRTVPVRFSALKCIEQSPAHYWQACQDNREETLSMRLGSGAHAILLGKPVTKWTGKVRNGKAWDAFEKEHEGELILNARELAEAEAMVKSIRSNALAMRLLDGTTNEQTIDWSIDGRACRSTPDARGPLWLVELKTAKSSEPKTFLRDAFYRRYHAQVAFYADAMRSTGDDPMDCYVIAVENTAPYPVSVLRLTDRALEHGRRLYRQWFVRLLECERENTWPGYSVDVLAFDVE